MSIGETSVASGVKTPTIRYYEQIGLLPEGKRDRGNRRRYDHAAVHRLQFIRTARELGFEVEAIREFLRIMATPELQTPDTARIAQAQLLSVRSKIARLERLRAVLSDAADGSQCANVTARLLLQLPLESGTIAPAA